LAEKARLKRKAEDERISFSNALTHLLSVVRKGKDLLGEESSDPLLSACRAVGNALRLTIISPSDAQKVVIPGRHFAGVQSEKARGAAERELVAARFAGPYWRISKKISVRLPSSPNLPGPMCCMIPSKKPGQP
jgi:hypothetical protein